jgi:hypothetical protein
MNLVMLAFLFLSSVGSQSNLPMSSSVYFIGVSAN